MSIEFSPSCGGYIGLLPNGKTEIFKSLSDYEDAFWDMTFELNNGFEIEMPEDIAA